LQYSHLPFELVEFKKSFFETPNFIFPNTYFLKDLSPIRNNSNEDDTKHTHPNTAKRKLQIGELIKASNNSSKTNSIIGQSEFEYIRDLSRFEICRLYLINRDYPNALYAAYILSNKYPNNQYVAEVISKCLYAITLYGKGEIRYTSDSYMENGISNYTDIESYPQQLYHFINKMPNNEWTIMSLNYTYRSHKKFPESKIINQLSDSLFNIMKSTNWGITDFVRKKEVLNNEIKKDTTLSEPNSKTDLIANLQKENNLNALDTTYYKSVF